ncbi:MAG: right-handed parallel beta-helix repeat-containing protein [Thermoplasmata archaeon]
MLSKIRIFGIGIVLFAIFWGFVAMPTVSASPGETSRIKISELRPHSPITIEKDSDFNFANGVVSGSGTEWDPYIIEGWEIFGSDDPQNYDTAIQILPTKKYFLIRNCVIHFGYIGIRLGSCSHAIIENNTIIDTRRFGIDLAGCSDIVCKNNHILNHKGYACIELEVWHGNNGNIPCEDVRIFSNIFEGGLGVDVQFGHRVVIASNWIRADCGILTCEAYNLKVFSNNFCILQAFVSAYDGEIIHNNFFTNQTKGCNGKPPIECASSQFCDTIFYNASKKEGNYWQNWDGKNWGTPEAYPIPTSAYDLYPLSNPLKNATPFIELPMKIRSGESIFGKIWICDENGKGIHDFYVEITIQLPDGTPIFYRHLLTDGNGSAEFKLQLPKEIEKHRICVVISGTKSEYLDVYSEEFSFIVSNDESNNIFTNNIFFIVEIVAVILPSATVIVGVRWLRKKRRKMDGTKKI